MAPTWGPAGQDAFLAACVPFIRGAPSWLTLRSGALAPGCCGRRWSCWCGRGEGRGRGSAPALGAPGCLSPSCCKCACRAVFPTAALEQVGDPSPGRASGSLRLPVASDQAFVCLPTCSLWSVPSGAPGCVYGVPGPLAVLFSTGVSRDLHFRELRWLWKTVEGSPRPFPSHRRGCPSGRGRAARPSGETSGRGPRPPSTLVSGRLAMGWALGKNVLSLQTPTITWGDIFSQRSPAVSERGSKWGPRHRVTES